MIFLKSAFWSVLMLVAAVQAASAQQRCPPNSRAEAVPVPGNLNTAQCFCDSGFVPVNGRCVRSRTDAPPPNDPNRGLVAPMQRRGVQ
jgi:hypothetical protein